MCSSALRVLRKAELFPAESLKVPCGGIAVFGATLKSPADPRFCALSGSETPMAES